jgi:hypothetical protein
LEAGYEENLRCSIFTGTLFPSLLRPAPLTLASLRLTQSLNLPWASDSKDWPNRDLVAGTLGLAAGYPRVLGCATREKLFRRKETVQEISICHQYLHNENTNGLLRQYFPKGIVFRTISEKDVVIVVKKLNNRPRKCLNYQTSHEVFSQALNGAP